MLFGATGFRRHAHGSTTSPRTRRGTCAGRSRGATRGGWSGCARACPAAPPAGVLRAARRRTGHRARPRRASRAWSPRPGNVRALRRGPCRRLRRHRHRDLTWTSPASRSSWDLTYVRHDARARETGAPGARACGFDSYRTTWARTSRSGSSPRACRRTVDGYVTVDAAFLRRHLRLGARPGGPRGPRMLAAARERVRHEPRLPGRVTRRAGRAEVQASRGGRRLGAAVAHPRSADRAPFGAGAGAVRRPTSGTGTTPPCGACRSPWRIAAVGADGRGPAAPARRWRRTGSGRATDRARRSGRRAGSPCGSSARAAAGGCSPRSRRRPIRRRRRCSPRRPCAWPFDDLLPPTAGQVTTAQAMGDALTERLRTAGITFRVAADRGGGGTLAGRPCSAARAGARLTPWQLVPDETRRPSGT